MKVLSVILSAVFLIGATGISSAQVKTDRYIGYYYPAPRQVEAYCARVKPLPNVNKKRRVGFIVGIKAGMSKQAYASPYSVFAKGGESKKLLIISKQNGYLNTIYRARALLAELSTSARTTPIFANSGAPEELTFLDLITMLGFETVTLSDGEQFTHQIHVLNMSHKQCKKANPLK